MAAKIKPYSLLGLVLLIVLGALEFSVARPQEGWDLVPPVHAAPLDQGVVFLPAVSHDTCGDFFDSFSNPYSGWPVLDDSQIKAQYFLDTYRVQTKQRDVVRILPAPTCLYQNYVVEADIYWESVTGFSYGLVLALTQSPQTFYTFEINADNQEYWIWQDDGNTTGYPVPTRNSSAIKHEVGNRVNHLEAALNRGILSFEVNGTSLGSYNTGITGELTGVGIVISSSSQEPFTAARFDNFRVTRLP